MAFRTQSTDPWNRPDIRFYAEGGAASFANLATDLGQYERDLSTGGLPDVVYLPAPATDFLLTTRTIALDITRATNSDCTLWINGTGGGGTLDRLRIASSQYEYRCNQLDVIAIAVPAGDHQIVVVRTEPNPGASVPSDAYMSTMEVMDVTNGVLYRAQATHAVRSFGANDFVLLANSTAGASSLIDAGGVCDKIRVSSRAVAFTEIAQDWIASLSDPTSSAKLVRQGLPLTEGSGVGDVGEFHGAAVQWAASELRHNQLRTMGALVNWRFRNTGTLVETSHTSTTSREKIMLAPGGNVGTGFRLHLGWFGVFPVHPMANALWVQVHAQCENVTDADLRTFGFRLYSFSRKPIISGGLVLPGEEPEPLDYRYAEATFTADESAPGSWRLQGKLPIAVGTGGISKGVTYLGLAYAIDLLDESTENLNLNVHAVHAVQMFDATVGAPQGGGPSGEAG